MAKSISVPFVLARQKLPERQFAQAARAISELLSTAVEELLARLKSVDAPRILPVVTPENEMEPAPEEPEEPTETPMPPEPILIPENRE